MRAWRRRSERGVTPIWIAATVVSLIGVALLLLVRLSLAGGQGTEYAVFGSLALSGGIVLGAVGGGIRNPYALLGIFGGLSILFIGAFGFNWFGAQGIL